MQTSNWKKKIPINIEDPKGAAASGLRITGKDEKCICVPNSMFSNELFESIYNLDSLYLIVSH